MENDLFKKASIRIDNLFLEIQEKLCDTVEIIDQMLPPDRKIPLLLVDNSRLRHVKYKKFFDTSSYFNFISVYNATSALTILEDSKTLCFVILNLTGGLIGGYELLECAPKSLVGLVISELSTKEEIKKLVKFGRNHDLVYTKSNVEDFDEKIITLFEKMIKLYSKRYLENKQKGKNEF